MVEIREQAMLTSEVRVFQAEGRAKCKVPEAGMCPMCWRKTRAAALAGWVVFKV